MRLERLRWKLRYSLARLETRGSPEAVARRRSAGDTGWLTVLCEVRCHRRTIDFGLLLVVLRQRLVAVEPVATVGAGARLALHWDDTTREVDVSALGPERLSMILPESAGRAERCAATSRPPASGSWASARSRSAPGCRTAGGDHAVAAPMPGRVVRVLVEPGERVAAGRGLAVVEAMKMENEVAAPADGVVSDVRAAPGDSVEAGGVLATLTAEESA